MAKRRGKPVSFDAMVKFFLKHYNLPTKSDLDKINARLDRLEALLRKSPGGRAPAAVRRKTAAEKSDPKAFEQVLGVIEGHPGGAGVREIRERTGFNDKKIRNILFRLKKTGRIQRKQRGIYTAS